MMFGMPFPARSKPYVGNAGIATRYWHAASVIPSTTTSVVSANRLYAQPIHLPGLAFDRIGLEITTGAAGNGRLGLYANADGIPGALMLDAGVIDTTNIAHPEIAITLMSLPEWCWIAGVFDATPTVRSGTGDPSCMGTATGGAACRGLISSGAFAYAELPATFPAALFSAVAPMFSLRKS